jgi:uncharacterized protein YbjT (DUF2867 family)
MNNSILVIGATGNVGRPLVEHLRARGETIKVATRTPQRYPGQPGVTAVYFDYENPATYAPALAGVDRVYAISAPTDSGVMDIHGLIPSLQQADLQHLVLVTGMPVIRSNGDLRHWEEVETPVIGSGIPYTLLRPGWFMQLFIEGFLLTMLQQQRRLCWTNGDVRICPIDARDIAAVAAVVLTQPGHAGQAYTLTGDEVLTLRDIAELLTQATGQPIPYANAPVEELVRFIEEVGGFPGPKKGIHSIFSTAERGVFAETTPIVAQLTGRAPRTFAQFAQEHAPIWRQ